MAYNRLGSPQRDEYDSPSLHPQYDNRSPSPGRPLQPYQLEDAPYRPQPPHLLLPTRSGDRLAMQPTYSVENIHNSQGHNQSYEMQRQQQGSGYASQDYVISPEEHHDAYY